MKANKKVLENIEEAYQNYKPYLDDDNLFQELREMCSCCEQYCEAEHDYENCRDKNCFQFWLCYKYLEWCATY